MRKISYDNSKYQQLTIHKNGLSIEKLDFDNSYEYYEISDIDELDNIISDLQDLRLSMIPFSDIIKEKLEDVVLP